MKYNILGVVVTVNISHYLQCTGLGFIISEILVENFVEENGRGLVRRGGLLSEHLSVSNE